MTTLESFITRCAEECVNGSSEPVQPIEIKTRRFGDCAADLELCPEKDGQWWWILADAYACSTDSRGVLRTEEAARADAVAYLRELRERIDVTLAALDAESGRS